MEPQFQRLHELRDEPDFDAEPDGLFQTQIGAILGISGERVGRIERRAMQKLRAAAIREAEAAGMSLREWLFGG
jgi:DNA-directed RNA polymerase specialized sigma24 family protein